MNFKLGTLTNILMKVLTNMLMFAAKSFMEFNQISFLATSMIVDSFIIAHESIHFDTPAKEAIIWLSLISKELIIWLARTLNVVKYQFFDVRWVSWNEVILLEM